MSKLHLLWAVLAIPSLALAEPAPSAPDQNVGLAIDYLTRELAARLIVPQGKTIQPDKPSKNSYTAEQMAAVRAVFGSDEPLLAKRQPGTGGRINYTLTLPAREYQDDTGKLVWQQATLQAAVAPGGSQLISSSLPALSIIGKDGRLDFERIRSQGTMQADYWSSKSRGEVGLMRFAPGGDESKGFSIDNMRFASEFKRQGQFYNGRSEFSFGRFSTHGHAVDDWHAAFRLRKLDARAMDGLKQEMNRLRSEGNAIAKAREAVAIYAPLLKRLAMRGAALEIEDLSASYKGQKLTIKGGLSMPNARDADFASIATVIKKLDGRLDVTVPLQLLREISRTLAENENRGKEAPEVPTAKLADQMYEMALGKMLANKYARMEKDMLRTTIELKAGVLAVNGNTISMEPFLALFEEKEVPPVDNEAPVAISMRERGLDAAQLFAMNGDRQGMLELCHRYAAGIEVEKDVQQAKNWCLKAWKEGSYSAASQLAELFLDGLLDDQEIVSYLQVAADKHAQEDAQFMMYRLHMAGKGVEKDLRKAKAYLLQAADQRYSKAVDALLASDASFKAAFESNPKAADPWTYTSSVAGGYVTQTSYRFDAGKSRSMRISMQSYRDHEKWAPMHSICLSALNPSDFACFQLLGLRGDTPAVQLSSHVRDAGHENRRNEKSLDTMFESSTVFEVQIHTDGRKVHFIVNGEDALTQDVDFPVEVMTMICSTADCRAEFQRVK